MLTPVRDHGNVKMISSTTSGPKCIKIPQSKSGGGRGGTQSGGWGGGVSNRIILHVKLLRILLMIVKSLREQYLSAFPVPSGVVNFFILSSSLSSSADLTSCITSFTWGTCSTSSSSWTSLWHSLKSQPWREHHYHFGYALFLSETQTLSLTLGKYVYM